MIKKMKRTKTIVLVMALLSGIVTAQAQEVSPMDFMRYNPYQMNANPATDLPYESVMSIIIGNIGLDIQNTSLRYDNLFEFNAQGRPATINLRQFANSVKQDNFLGVNAHVDLFTLFRRTKFGLLTVNWGVKAQADLRCNDGLFKLLGYGNSAFVGESNPAVVNMDVDAMVYQELAVGYQRNITDKLSLGFRGKVLFGFGDIKTDAIDAKLFTDADSYALRMEENIAMRASMPRAVYAQDGHLMTNGPFKLHEIFRNPGFAVDMAAEYRFDDRFSLVAAVNDLGFIHWGMNNIEVKGQINDAGQFYDHGDFLYEGLDIDQLQRVISDECYREQFFDTLQQYFRIGVNKMGAYNTMLNTNILLRGNFDINPSHRFSAQVRGRFLAGNFRPAVTLAYCGSFINHFNVCATYTIAPGSYDNIGLGLSAMIGTCNIYLTTNNLIGCFKPLNAGGFNAQVGIVFNLWMPERRFIDESGKPEYLE